MITQLPRKELITLDQHFQLTHAITHAYHLKFEDETQRHKRLIAITLNIREERVDMRLVELLSILMKGYGNELRRSGTPKVLHPLRVMSIVTMARHQLDENDLWLDQIGALIHDFNEDFNIPKIEYDSFPQGDQRAQELERIYRIFRQKLLDQNQQWVIGERRENYTHRPFDDKTLSGYCRYLWDILKHSHPSKDSNLEDLIRVKLADRIDNTLDHRPFYTSGTEYNFYRTIFDVLFVPDFKGPQLETFVAPLEVESGADTLMQLFKSMIFLSLIRKFDIERPEKIDYHPATIRLFKGLAVAGIRVAQLALLELLATAENVKQVKEVLTQSQCKGTIDDIVSIKKENDNNSISIDGLMVEVFEKAATGKKKELLASLFQQKEKLALILVKLIATFSKFLNDRQFYIRGIESDGIRPE